MGVKKNLTFGETSWEFIEKQLPNDENVKFVVLLDFMWFFNRTKKYKSNQQAIDDYIRHLELKATLRVDHIFNNSEAFMRIDRSSLKSHLLEIFIEK